MTTFFLIFVVSDLSIAGIGSVPTKGFFCLKLTACCAEQYQPQHFPNTNLFSAGLKLSWSCSWKPSPQWVFLSIFRMLTLLKPQSVIRITGIPVRVETGVVVWNKNTKVQSPSEDINLSECLESGFSNSLWKICLQQSNVVANLAMACSGMPGLLLK